MNSLDLSPLYRNSIGFDRLTSLLDNARNIDANVSGYPPYNIEAIDDNKYTITLAVAGFERDELDLMVEKDVLYVRGIKARKEERHYVHQGIANRAFERKFNLADHVEVTGADLSNGLLTINLVREVPEEMKPRSIPINDAGTLLNQADSEDAEQVDSKAA
ncbi:Small heat shock protein IbpA [Halioglobus japonicus]|nr:Small heat shock protein IbpA [Halioglobus japonicus]